MHLSYCELSVEILLVPSIFSTIPYEKDQAAFSISTSGGT